MNLQSYKALIEKVGVENLDEANRDTYNIVKQGSDNFRDPELWNEMLIEADIKEAYELHIKALEKLARESKAEIHDHPGQKVKTKKMRKEKPKPKSDLKPIHKSHKPEKQVRVKKKNTLTKVKKTRAKKEEAILQPAQVRYPVTIKRFSKELQLIKRFVGMDGKKKSVKGLQSFFRSIDGTLKDHPDRKPVLSEMHKRLRDVLHKAEAQSATDVIMNLEGAFKEKLISSVKGARPKLKLEYLAGVKKKSPIQKGLSGPGNDGLFQKINSIDQHTKDTFRLKGDLGKFLGDLETYKLAMSIEGDQGAGKTQLVFQLADGFADLGYSVGLFELEIGANSNIVRKFRDGYIKSGNRDRVNIAGEAPEGIITIREYAHKFGVVIIDSWTKLEVDSQEFDKLRNDFSDTIWIVLFQRTSAKSIRGGTKPLYDAGINIEVIKVDDTFTNNYAVATKNRYGQTGIKYNVSKKKITA